MLVVLAASSVAVLGCADDGRTGDSAGSAPASGTSAQPRTFAETVNSLCDQRHTAIGAMQRDVFQASAQFVVGDLVNAFARSSLGVVRDQIPLLRVAPQAPAGWDSLVSDYERLAQASNVAAGDAAAIAFAWFDPFRDIDLRAYEMGATSCPAAA